MKGATAKSELLRASIVRRAHLRLQGKLFLRIGVRVVGWMILAKLLLWDLALLLGVFFGTEPDPLRPGYSRGIIASPVQMIAEGISFVVCVLIFRALGRSIESDYRALAEQ